MAPWRALVAAALLSLLAGAALARGPAGEHARVLPAGGAGVTSHRGLASLLLAAQGAVSSALGAEVSSALGAASRAYGVSASPEGLQAVSPAQRLHTRFGRSGVMLSAGAVKAGLSLRAIGFGASLTALGSVTPSARDNRVSYARSGLDEWYVNGPLGLEQGFTLARAPAGDPVAPLTLSIALSGDARVSIAGGQSLTFSHGRGTALRYGGLLATDATGRRLPSWLTLRGKTMLLRVDARGARYPLRIDPLIQLGAKLKAGEESHLGLSVALSADGNTALIGAPGGPKSAGVALVFTRSGLTWTQPGQALTAKEEGIEEGKEACSEETGEEEGECAFGRSVALSADGNTALVGSPRDNHHEGAVWVFTRLSSKSKWSQVAKLTGVHETSKGHFGRSVALSGDGNTALVGGPTDRGDHGGAWVFRRSDTVGSEWISEETAQGPVLTGGEESGEGFFGANVALSADGSAALIGGAADAGNAGAAWAFTRSGSTWTQQGSKLTGAEEGGAGRFGSSVALSADGNTALIGGRQDSGRSGAAWAFSRSGPQSDWTAGAKLMGSEEIGEGEFGYSAALSADGSKAVIGGPRDNGRGAAWVFAHAGMAWTEQPRKLTGGEEKNGGEIGKGWFGASVALAADGESGLVGAPNDNGKAGAAFPVVEEPPPPTVTKVEPNEGPVEGGTKVTLTGTELSEATQVTFTPKSGLNPIAASFTVKSPTEIEAVTPPSSRAGAVNVTVTAQGLTSAIEPGDEFTYLAHKGPRLLQPIVTAVSPAEGPAAGGTLVTITGKNLTGATVVEFEHARASFTVISATEISATTPPGAVGTVGVTVTTPGGSSAASSSARFTYLATPPGNSGGRASTTSLSGSGGVLGFGPFTLPTCTISLLGKSIAVQSYKLAALKLFWAGKGTCSGTLKLTVKTKSAHKRTRTKTIGTGTFSIQPGAVRTVKIKLNAAGRALLKAHHGRLNASLAIVKLSPGPTQARSASVRLTLQKPKKATKQER